jgi:hypothetical protein
VYNTTHHVLKRIAVANDAMLTEVKKEVDIMVRGDGAAVNVKDLIAFPAPPQRTPEHRPSHRCSMAQDA